MSAADHSWEDWFAEGVDPFAPNNDGEISGTVHLLRHGVDIGQAMKTGALWWRVDGDAADLANPGAALDWAESYLHRPDGMYFADEEVGGDHTPSRGTETCSVVEMMFSMRTAFEVTGNISYMDRLERVAFNALPAALWPDVTSNVYHHSSNQLEGTLESVTSKGSPFFPPPRVALSYLFFIHRLPLFSLPLFSPFSSLVALSTKRLAVGLQPLLLLLRERAPGVAQVRFLLRHARQRGRHHRRGLWLRPLHVDSPHGPRHRHQRRVPFLGQRHDCGGRRSEAEAARAVLEHERGGED